MAIAIGGNLLVKIMIIIFTVLAQGIGAAIIPYTAGFTRPGPIAVCILSTSIGMFLMSKLIESGMSLSIVVPLLTCAVPITAITIGYFAYGDTISLQRACFLAGALACVSVASQV